METLGKILTNISHMGYYDNPPDIAEYDRQLQEKTTLTDELAQVQQAKAYSISGRISAAFRVLRDLQHMPSMQFVPFEKVEKNDVLAFINYETALFYRNAHDFTSAQNYLKIAKLLAESAEVSLLVDYQFATIRAEHHADIELMMRFVRIFQETDMPVMEIMANMRLGEILAGLEKYDQARETMVHCGELIDRVQSANLSTTQKSNLGFIYYLEQNYRSALDTFSDVQDCPDYYQKSLVLENMALVYEAKEDYQTALNYWMDSLNVCQDHGVLVNIPEDSLRIGMIYERHLKQYSQAKFFFKLGYDQSMEMFRDGINITGYMKEVIEKYIGFFSENYVPEERPQPAAAGTEAFAFSINRTWEDTRNIFHYNLIVFHKFSSKSVGNMLNTLKLKRSNFQAKQQKLVALGFQIPDFRRSAKVMDQSQIVEELQDWIRRYQDQTWKDINQQFEKEIFKYFVDRYGSKKEQLVRTLKISYPSLNKKLKTSMN